MMMDNLYQFLSGGIFVACWVVGLYFLRIWKDTKDYFFLAFSFAFALMAIERIPLSFMNVPDETYPFLYLTRLFAFLLLIVAIGIKNGESKPVEE